MKILITSGGTKVKIDRVRHIGNMSSGTFGTKIALEALKAGHEVNFLMAKGSKHPLLPDFKDKVYGDLEFMSICKEYAELQKKYSGSLWIETYEDFYDYQKKVEVHSLGTGNRFGAPDVIILAAAVSDYGVENPVDGKIRSKDSEMSIKLYALPKIISSVRGWAPKSFIVGFKLLVDSTDEELIKNAKDSILKNNINLVVANDLRDIKNNNHRLHIVSDKVEFFEASDMPEDHNYLARKVIESLKERK